jgi:hypothetical protein
MLSVPVGFPDRNDGAFPERIASNDSGRDRTRAHEHGMQRCAT